MWDVTCDTLHMTHSVGWTFSQHFSSLAFPVGYWQCLEDIWTKGSLNQLMNEWMNDGGDCRTDHATPGLLTIPMEFIFMDIRQAQLALVVHSRIQGKLFSIESRLQH